MSRLSIALTLLFAATLRAEDGPALVLDSGGHTAKIWKVLFTPSGKELISVSADRSVRIWDVDNGELLGVLRPPSSGGYEGSLFAAAVSPDGRLLVVAGNSPAPEPGIIYLIDLASGTLERRLRGHKGFITSLAFSPNGERIASGSADSTVRVWNAASGVSEQVLVGQVAPYGLAFSPDGQRVVAPFSEKSARIWSVATGAGEAELTGTGSARSVAWSRDGTIATGGPDQSVRLWNSDGKLLKTHEKVGGSILSLNFAADGKHLLLSRNSVASVLDLDSGKQAVTFTNHDAVVLTSALSPDGELAATAGGHDHQIFLWKTSDGSVTRRLAGKGRAAFAAAWGMDGQTIAWGNSGKGNPQKADAPLERSFRLSDLEFGPAPTAEFRRAHPSRNGATLEKVNRTTVAVRKENATVAEMKMGRSSDNVYCFTFLGDNRVAVGSYFFLGLYDALTGKFVRALPGHAFDVWAVAPSPDDRYLLSASGDQTLRIWTPDRGEPLVSLFFGGDEWIAWTPEGYYAASPGGERLMGWQVDNGPEKLASFYPASQFRKSLYRPDVIKLLLKGGSVDAALAEADKARGKVTERAPLKRILPPKVSIASPAPGKLAKAEVTVSAIAVSQGKHPVTAMHLTLDGQPLAGADGVRRFDPPTAGEVRASWTIALAPGKHRLQVLADSGVSQGASEEVVIDYHAEQPVLRQPRLVVLAVGVSNYTNANVGKLDYAASDAKAVAAAFEAHGKALFHETKLKLLTDEAATRDAVLDGLDWLVKETKQDDYAVVFFAGHGETDNASTVYFLPVDADKEKLRRSAVAGEELMKTFRDLPPSKRVLILDACHAGAVKSGKKRSDASVTDNLARELLTPENGVVVMCSSTGREFSQESHQHKMGVFTLALTEGLSGKGPKDNGGLVFTHHLHSYVCDRVKDLTGGQQHPVMKNPDEIRSFPVSKP